MALYSNEYFCRKNKNRKYSDIRPWPFKRVDRVRPKSGIDLRAKTRLLSFIYKTLYLVTYDKPNQREENY